MRHNVKQEFTQSMDSLRFSARAKEDMTQMLMNEMNKQKAPRRRGGRKMLVLGLAAATLLVTLTGAAVYTRTSRTVNAVYKMTEKQKQTAENSGLSVMLEETKETQAPAENPSVISATDQGITITAVQTLVDKYRAKLVFRVEGFDLPEGAYPSVEGGVVSVAGKEYPGHGIQGRINNGLVTDPVNKTAAYADGSPLEYDEEGATILKPLAQDGSFEVCIDLFFPTKEKSGLGTPNFEYMEHLGSEIVVKFTNIGVEDYLDHVPMVAGDWTLKWTLTGTDESLIVQPHVPIGTSGFTLLNAEITPLSCILTMEGDAYSHKQFYVDEYSYWIPHMTGTILTDGTFVPKPSYGGGSFGEIAPNIHFSNDECSGVDLDKIQALVFGNMEEIGGEDYIVPIR